MTYTDLNLEISDQVAVLTLSRPKVLNAFRNQTYEEFEHALQVIEEAPTVRVVVICGEGPAFCAGADLRELMQQIQDASFLKDAGPQVERMQQLTRSIVESDRIFISCIHGATVGVGAELALASDIRVGGESTVMQFSEASRGLFQTNGVMYFLPRMVGLSRAMDYLLSCRDIYANEALAAGLISRVVKDGSLFDEALALARRIASHAPIPIRLIKQMLRAGLGENLEQVLQRETAALMSVLDSADLREGVAAFSERRQPQFAGH